jgi:hypothetical protein
MSGFRKGSGQADGSLKNRLRADVTEATGARHVQESDDTSHEVRAPSGEINSGDRCAGLPSQHHPLSGFLTLSAV